MVNRLVLALMVWLLMSLGIVSSAIADKTAVTPTPLLLISIDGLRWDYLQQHKPPALLEIAEQGAMVEQLLPVFPSSTFPNHISLATGLYAENHGIVSNRFYSPSLGTEYNRRKSKSVTDGRFYGGVPIWSLAEQQGRIAAVYFWPGSEAEIGGQRPTYVKPYRSGDSHKKRIEQVAEWLQLPQDERPDYISLYFSVVDSAGHKYGPLHSKTRKALLDVDDHIRRLLEQIQQMATEVNVIIVGDHGMRHSGGLPTVFVDKRIEKERSLRRDFRILGSGSMVQFYYRGSGNKQQALKRLESALTGYTDSHYYQQGSVSKALHFSNHSAIGDAILLSNDHYLTYSNASAPPRGVHGFDARFDPQMRSLLLAIGPSFKPKARLEQASNVDLYPIMAHLMGLEISQPIDGRFKVLAPLLASSK